MPRRTCRRRTRILFGGCMLGAGLASAALGRAEPAAGEISERTATFDYIRRKAMIRMRDGVKLCTLILIPRTPTAPAHGLLTMRTRTAAYIELPACSNRRASVWLSKMCPRTPRGHDDCGQLWRA